MLFPEAALVKPVETHHIEPVEESTGLIGNIKLSDFVKIFVDCTEIAELSAEQVKRIRESKFMWCCKHRLRRSSFISCKFLYIACLFNESVFLILFVVQCMKKYDTASA